MSQDTVNYFLDGYRNAGNQECISHGISFGLGLVAMATKNLEVFNELKNVLFHNPH